MGFAENLKQIRKERGLSQEDLAEIMDVSRQAVSKWEQGMGYPEVEKLLTLATKLNISLDALMDTAPAAAAAPLNAKATVSGSIVITSPHENVILTCQKVMGSQKMKGGKRSPSYALMGVSNSDQSLFGPTSTFLGWYADEDALNKEIRAIQAAISQGLGAYELQYSVKVIRKRASLIIEDLLSLR